MMQPAVVLLLRLSVVSASVAVRQVAVVVAVKMSFAAKSGSGGETAISQDQGV